MQVKIIKKYICFYNDVDDEILKPNNGLQYKEGDIIFISKEDDGRFKIKKYQDLIIKI